MRHYIKKHGSYYYYADNPIQPKLLFMSDEIAVAFDRSTFTMLKHGKRELVESWVKTARGAYHNAGFEDVDIIVITSNKWEDDDLNRFINTSGYIEYWLKENSCKTCKATILEDCDTGLHG